MENNHKQILKDLVEFAEKGLPVLNTLGSLVKDLEEKEGNTVDPQIKEEIEKVKKELASLNIENVQKMSMTALTNFKNMDFGA